MNGKEVFYINTEASDKNVAIADSTTFAPKLMYAHASGAEADIFPVFGNANPAQHNIIDSIPTPVGPTNTDPQYSPLWGVVPLRFNVSKLSVGTFLLPASFSRRGGAVGDGVVAGR